MKICFFGDAGSIHLQRWVQYFITGGNQVWLFSYRSTAVAGVQRQIFIDLNLSRLTVLGKVWQTVRAIVTLRLELLKIKPDIVHIHYIIAHPILIGFWKVRGLFVSGWGADVVYDGSAVEPGRHVFFKKFILKQARVITATSRFLARRAVPYSPPGKKIWVVPFGVPCEYLRPTLKQQPRDGVTLAFIKHLKPKYGPGFLIQAMPAVYARYPKTRLLIIGEGEQEQELKRMVSELGLEKNIFFKGAIPHWEVKQVLAETDIFVMPSIYESESFGVAAVEAQAMAIPIVATRVGGVPEVVEDRKTGLLVEPRSAQQLAQAIVRLIENSEMRRRMGHEARKFIMKHYQWENNARQMEQLYRHGWKT